MEVGGDGMKWVGKEWKWVGRNGIFDVCLYGCIILTDCHI